MIVFVPESMTLIHAAALGRGYGITVVSGGWNIDFPNLLPGVSLAGTPGEKGDKGDKGEQGLKGDKGDQGSRGYTGANGADGKDGTDGGPGLSIVSVDFVDDDMIFTMSDDSTVILTDAKISLKGDTGETGETGATGLTGEDGADGVGVPSGGTAGQRLEKIDGTDYNTQWATPKALKTKIGYFTHDISATGDQAITGVGFQPVSILFMGGIPDNKANAMGFADGTNEHSLWDQSAHAAGSYGSSIADYALLLYTADYTDAYFNVKSMDSDGFTVTWGKDGSPTGTARIMYLAIGFQ